MQKVFTAQHPTEAHLVKGLLESAGIAAEVQGEALFGVRGGLPMTGDTLPTVWILEDDQLDDAKRVLEAEPESAG